MKRFLPIFGSLFFFLLFSNSVCASEGFADLAKLVRMNVGYEVLQAYTQHSGVHYNLTADEIVLLNDFGVPATILDGMLSKTEGASSNVSVNDANDRILASTMTLVPSAQESNLSLFYDALSPFGTWSQDTQLGWVWSPTAEVYDTTWRPYVTEGSWVWTNTGWFWNSHYSWGWAPFHFGRWEFTSTSKWVWAPDVNWSPAWVTWRTAPGYFGWAPLPSSAAFDPATGFKDKNADFGLKADAFSFVPANRFLAFDSGAVLAPQDQIENIFKDSKVINDFEVSNGTAVNRGIPEADVAGAMKIKLPPISVEWAKVKAGDPIPPTLFEGKEKLTTYRPVLAKDTTLTPQQASERRDSPEMTQRRVALVEQAQQQRAKYSEFEDQRLSMLAGQIHFRAEAERRRHGMAPAHRPSPTSSRMSPGAPPAEPRSQQLERSATKPSSSIRPSQDLYRARIAAQQLQDDMLREHAGVVQARADAADRAREADIASRAAMEWRDLVRQGGNNQDGSQWQRGIEIQRLDYANLVAPEEPSRPEPVVFENLSEEQIRSAVDSESRDTRK